jgi:hypothetical protein
MDIFGGNPQLAAAVFTGIDLALFTRHTLTDTMIPVVLVFKGGEITHHIVTVMENPTDYLEDFIRRAETPFEQVVMCMEGKVSGGDDRKHDAMLIKAFDASMPNGLLIGQRFVPLESGQPFSRLGRPALFENEIPLPVPVVEREPAEPNEPYLSGIIAGKEDKRRIIIAGYQNPSVLANELKTYARDILKQADDSFSGNMEISIVPDSFAVGSFETWLFDELITRIKEEPAVTKWEQTYHKQVVVTVKFNNKTKPQIV